jgi:predicted nucleotidyltransferase
MLSAQEIMQFTLSEAERSVLKGFVAQCRQYFGPRAEQILLYGSRARGDVAAESDIDVLVLLCDQPTLADREWIADAAFSMTLKAQPFIDLMPRLMSRQQLEDLIKRERRFGLEIADQGIPL